LNVVLISCYKSILSASIYPTFLILFNIGHLELVWQRVSVCVFSKTYEMVVWLLHWMFKNTWVPPFICFRTTSFQKQYFTVFLRVSTCETHNCTVHVNSAIHFALFTFFFSSLLIFLTIFFKKTSLEWIKFTCIVMWTIFFSWKTSI